MKKNMGIFDRAARITAAVVIIILYFTRQIDGAPAIVLGVIAVIFLLTSLTGRCPAYIPFGISTMKRSS